MVYDGCLRKCPLSKKDKSLVPNRLTRLGTFVLSIGICCWKRESCVTLHQNRMMMKAKNVCWVVIAIALAACSGNDKSQLGDDRSKLGELPVVAHQVEVDEHELTVCNLDLMKDTINLPLSFWLEDMQVVKLDGQDEALVGMGPVRVSENYILVGRATNVPCKLFRKDGSFVGKVGNIGQGPGEYTMVYDMQIDEKAGHVYLLPWNAQSIFVYNLNGEYLKDIPLNRKYEKLIIPKGKFKVDAENNRVAVMLLPFDYLPVVAWIQDMEGNFIHEVSDKHLKLKPDFSNEVLSCKTVGNALDVHIFVFWELKQDTLYHLNMDDGKLHPQFTMNFGQRGISMHDYFELPQHFVGTLVKPKQISDSMYETKDECHWMVDKENKRGAFFRIVNDYLDEQPIKYMPLACSEGYYTLNIEPSVLAERIEKRIKNQTDMTDEERKILEKLFEQIDEDDNNYIFIGKLKENFDVPSNASLRLAW